MSSSISGRENSGFAKDLDAVLAEARLQATNLRHGAAEPCRNGRHPDTTLGRMVELRPEVGRHKLFVASPARVRNGSVNLTELPKVMAGLIYLGIRREPTLPEHGGMRSPSSPRSNAFRSRRPQHAHLAQPGFVCMSSPNRNAKSSSWATAGSSHNGEGDGAGRHPDDGGRAGMVGRGTDRGEQVGASGHVERFAVRSDGKGERLMRHRNECARRKRCKCRSFTPRARCRSSASYRRWRRR